MVPAARGRPAQISWFWRVTMIRRRPCRPGRAAWRPLRAHGAHIQLIDVGPVDHDTSLILAFPKLLSWFQHRS
jgi:hypothetical protein